MPSVTVTITGTQEEIDKLRSLGDKLNDFGDATKEIGDRLTNYYASEAFGSQGGVFGEIWPDLNPIYAKRKAKLYPGAPILYITGTMERSFTYESDSNSVVIGNSAPYFKYHQSTEPRTKMPYRPMMLINDDVRSIAHDAIQKDVDQKLANL